MGKNTQKRIVLVLSTALAAVAATKLAGMLVDEPEERGAGDDVKEALLQGAFSIAATIAASYVIRNVLAKRWGA